MDTIYVRFMKGSTLVHYTRLSVYAIPRLGETVRIEVSEALTHNLTASKVTWVYTKASVDAAPPGTSGLEHIEVEVA